MEKSKTQYKHRREELVIVYQQDGVTFDLATEKVLLNKITHVSRGKSSTHFTLPRFPENSKDSSLVEQLKSFLVKKGVKKNELHFDENLQPSRLPPKIVIKIDYYEVIPPRCDKFEYVDPGNHRCAFDNNMAMMITDPAVFFKSDTNVDTRASDSVEAIKAHDKEWSKEDKAAASSSSLVPSVTSLVNPGGDK